MVAMSAPTRPKRRAGLPLRNFPLDLKRALGQRAADQGTNFNDVCVAILARRLRIRYDSQPRPSPGISDSTYVTLEMPEKLRAKIKATAAMRRLSSQALVITELSSELNATT